MAKLWIAFATGGVALAVSAIALAGQADSTGQAKVQVVLKEMAISAPGTAHAGSVTFVARNGGTVEHELVVVRGAGPLQVAHFKAEEAGRWIGEVEDVAPGKSKTVTLTLAPGKYTLICNVVGHYQLGMRRVLRVS